MHEKLVTTNTILYCRAWEQTVRFYKEGLRLPVLFSTHWFVEFGLTATSRLSIADEKHASIRSCGSAGITIALQVEDISAAREYAERMDLKPTAIQEHPWEAMVFHVFDPEGHRIEVWQSLAAGEPLD
ncbi:MAG TPA: VOC family protein [Thermoleophilia bacterium]|nr:VOC family protein [Thermoleophilia bacterium]